MQQNNRPALWTVSFLASCLLAPLPFRAQTPGEEDPARTTSALSTLGKDEYREELAWWAADEREGREPGTPGSREAAENAARQFRKLGLKPVGDETDGKPTYFQLLHRGGKRGLLPGHRLAVGERTFQYEKDWSLLGGCDEVDLDDVEVVFAGYGITAPEYDYDDYHGIDARGKAVLILRYEPREKDRKSRWRGAVNTRHAYFQTKLQNARRHGARAVLFVNGPLHHRPEVDPLMGLSTRVGGREKIPMVHIRKSIAEALLARAGLELLGVQEEIDREAKPASRSLPGIGLDIQARVAEIEKARNVLGLLEGSDPRLREEVVVVGAHYDHLGRGEYGSRKGRGEIHNGADDNASGTVGVLELAEAFVEGNLRPRRSILFQLYDAEEKGLLGSRHYVDHPAVPLERTVAMINLDMIGHSKKCSCSIEGTATAKEWKAILEQAEGGSPLKFNHRQGAGGDSDQASFLRKKIPVLFFCTGFFPAYHTPDDDAEGCNHRDAVEILKVVLKVTALVADREDRLTFQEPPSRGRRGPFLGVQLTLLEEGENRVQIGSVVPGSGAEKAGLMPGDVFLSLGEKPIRNPGDLLSALGGNKPGDRVKVRYLRGDSEGEVEVELGSR